MYAVVDIETTGGNSKKERITEIAIYKYNGKEIVDAYQTLINPEVNIPYYITQLTGITNSMVADAPRFYEVARDIIEFLNDTIFVAHNVMFDYSFIREEYKRLGYPFKMEKLCTVVLSRKTFPGHRSYSLGNICKVFDIEIKKRHRADGDAYATTLLLGKILDEQKQQGFSLPGEIDQKLLNESITPQVIKALPEEAGVYYFYNDTGQLIYIGKSVNIKDRVYSHFQNVKSKKAFEMKESIAEISFELTGNNIIAELKESAEIKKFKPKYNRLLRRNSQKFAIYDYLNQQGYLCLQIAKTDSKSLSPIKVFANQQSAKNYMNSIIDKYQLCQKLCGLYQSYSSCFHYEIMECKGACIGEEPASEYNKRVEEFLELTKMRRDSFFIIESGRNKDELGVVKVEQGVFKGFGYTMDNNNTPFDLDNCIALQTDDKDAQQIIMRYLREGKPKDIVYFKPEEMAMGS